MRTARLAAPLLALTLLLAGCSDTEDAPETTPDTSSTPRASSSSPAASAEPTEEPTGPTLDITVNGDTIGPNGERIDLPVGEPLTITFTADRAGELHVHSRPEQILEFTAGTSTTELIVDNPGVVDIEEHETGVVVAQLEVR